MLRELDRESEDTTDGTEIKHIVNCLYHMLTPKDLSAKAIEMLIDVERLIRLGRDAVALFSRLSSIKMPARY